MKPMKKLITAVLALALASFSCKTLQTGELPQAGPTNPPTQAAPTPTAAPTLMAPISSNQPFEINGSFQSTSEIGGELSDNILYAERQVILVDLHGFVTRNKEWEIPVDSQVIGNVKYNPADASGTYTIFLPQIPQGTLNDVDNNEQQDIGVQIFVVDYEPNIMGDPFMTGNDSLRGWPGNLASIKTTPGSESEVFGGQLIIYAPDENQGFPRDFGTDGKLFTLDDPSQNIPAGYSIVDLDTRPFKVSQPAVANLPLYEAPDAGPKDFSKETYTQSFDHLIEFVRNEYAFNGIPGKQPDWDKLVTELRPRVDKAEKGKNPAEFYEALRDFTYAFKDGHVGLDGGDFSGADFRANYAGSLGFTVRVLNNNQVLVNSVLKGSSAQAAGMKTGAIISQFNEKPVMDVIKAQPLFFGNQSSDVSILYSQAIMLTRTKPDEEVSVTFTNPGEKSKTANLRAEPEVDSLLAELGYTEDDGLVPVELDLLPVNGENVGYIKVSTNIDDLNLILRLFERGLKKFAEKEVTGVIVDLRDNSGGVPLGLAGYLTDQEITLGQMEYYDSALGKFSADGKPDTFNPKQPQYRFDKIGVLVGLNCASACEIEAYALGQLPGAVIVGLYPSAGIEAEVSKGQVKMPEGINMQFPTGRIINPDGSLFLEGTGVQPTLQVPVTAANILSKEDVVLQTALQAIGGK